jgi:hypothetical protein
MIEADGNQVKARMMEKGNVEQRWNLGPSRFCFYPTVVNCLAALFLSWPLLSHNATTSQSLTMIASYSHRHRIKSDPNGLYQQFCRPWAHRCNSLARRSGMHKPAVEELVEFLFYDDDPEIYTVIRG